MTDTCGGFFADRQRRCSGIHRGMGTHISRVKSVDLDSWTDEQLQSMLKWGNTRANKYAIVAYIRNALAYGDITGIGKQSSPLDMFPPKRMCPLFYTATTPSLQD